MYERNNEGVILDQEMMQKRKRLMSCYLSRNYQQ